MMTMMVMMMTIMMMMMKIMMMMMETEAGFAGCVFLYLLPGSRQ